jgi:hypothetical protein
MSSATTDDPFGGIFGPLVAQPKKGPSACVLDVKVTPEIKRKRDEIASLEEELKKLKAKLECARSELDALESKDPMYDLSKWSYTDMTFKTSKLKLSEIVAIPLPDRLKHLPDFKQETDLNLSEWQKFNLSQYLVSGEARCLSWE